MSSSFSVGTHNCISSFLSHYQLSRHHPTGISCFHQRGLCWLVFLIAAYGIILGNFIFMGIHSIFHNLHVIRWIFFHTFKHFSVKFSHSGWSLCYFLFLTPSLHEISYSQGEYQTYCNIIFILFKKRKSIIFLSVPRHVKVFSILYLKIRIYYISTSFRFI